MSARIWSLSIRCYFQLIFWVLQLGLLHLCSRQIFKIEKCFESITANHTIIVVVVIVIVNIVVVVIIIVNIVVVIIVVVVVISNVVILLLLS